MEQEKISFQIVFAASLILLLVEFLLAGIISWTGLHPLFAIGIARAAEIAAMFFVFLRWGNGLESTGLSREKIGPGLRKGLAWSTVLGLCGFLLFGVLHIAGYNFKEFFPSPVQKTALSLFLLFLVGGLISPVAEEIFFRGIMYGYLRRWGAILAILGSSALFAMAHLMTTGVTFVQIIGGLVFAVAYEKEKNLIVPITIHVLGNMVIFTLTILLVP